MIDAPNDERRDDIIERLHYDDAEAFLEAVAPRHRLWAPDPLAWVFRGHARAEWALRAKAHRADARPFEPFGIDASVEGNAQAWDVYGTAVVTVLKRFRNAIDRAGFAIPAEAPEVTYTASRMSYMSEPRPDALPLMALAQHVGIPTPLLDWSRYARVAAYFAATEAAEARPLEGAMCVWALRADVVHRLEHETVEDTELTLVNAPAATNPNLHAQAGVFTWARGGNGHAMTVDAFVCSAARLHSGKVPARTMRSLTLPNSCAPKLLRLLSYEGVSAASMFPGFAGVVRAMKERALWDQPAAEPEW